MKQVTDLGAIEKVVDEIVAKQSRQGRRGQDQPEGDRLVRRTGDEGVRRQGQPAGGERAAEEQARTLMRCSATLLDAVRGATMRRKSFSRAHRPIVATSDERRCDVARDRREAESLASDSRVFDRIRPSRDASASASVENFFDLGKNDTAHGFATACRRCAQHLSCSTRARNRNRRHARKARIYIGFSASVEISSVRASRITHARAKRVRAAYRSQTMPVDFGGRVHSLLSGVGVFSVVLV